MDKCKVYISCPVSVSAQKFGEYLKHVATFPVEASFWQRNTKYDPNNLKNADAVLFILPENKFKMPFMTLPSGCFKELNTAVELKKPIFLLYKSSFGIYVYSTAIDTMFSGIPGSSSEFRDFVIQHNEQLRPKKDELTDLWVNLTNCGTEKVSGASGMLGAINCTLTDGQSLKVSSNDSFWADSPEGFVIKSGSVGLGTPNPNMSLHVIAVDLRLLLGQ